MSCTNEFPFLSDNKCWEACPKETTATPENPSQCIGRDGAVYNRLSVSLDEKTKYMVSPKPVAPIWPCGCTQSMESSLVAPQAKRGGK